MRKHALILRLRTYTRLALAFAMAVLLAHVSLGGEGDCSSREGNPTAGMAHLSNVLTDLGDVQEVHHVHPHDVSPVPELEALNPACLVRVWTVTPQTFRPRHILSAVDRPPNPLLG